MTVFLFAGVILWAILFAVGIAYLILALSWEGEEA